MGMDGEDVGMEGLSFDDDGREEGKIEEEGGVKESINE
jgi:hypothetical protein